MRRQRSAPRDVRGFPALRAARADALDRYLDECAASYSEIAADLLGHDGWTLELLDQALEDLARDGRVNLRGDLGYLEVEPLLEMEAAA